MNRRQRERAWEEERKRQAEEHRQRKEREEAARALGAFIMEADEQRLVLIERFGVSALRAQHRANAEAYRRETKHWQEQHARRALADALTLAARHPPPPSFRVVLRAAESESWRSEEYRRELAARRRRAEAELAKVGYEAGDG